MRTDELDFELPPELIAQSPPAQRSASRLMHYRRSDGVIAHRIFSDLPGMLRPGDLLVFNDARVLPARFTLRKSTGGRVEALFLSEIAPGRWRALLRDLGRQSKQPLTVIGDDLLAEVIAVGGGGECELQINTAQPAAAILERIGRMPLPPYIHRGKDGDDRDAQDRERYQTVFAAAPGAIAAPTAALHFSAELLDELKGRGIDKTFVTLHVGMGTFKPVTADTLAAHAMHSESYEICPQAAADLSRAKAEGRRIIAVGTTSARVLESQPAGSISPINASTNLLIYPPYRWKHVAALLTNFHLPRSTLIALVAAFVGLDGQRNLYREAIGQRYRFFSYGDAMFLE